ncbi:MAG: hypothetical protein Q9169_002201 [Polycauliona sp. 2 TL-2023]
MACPAPNHKAPLPPAPGFFYRSESQDRHCGSYLSATRSLQRPPPPCFSSIEPRDPNRQPKLLPAISLANQPSYLEPSPILPNAYPSTKPAPFLPLESRRFSPNLGSNRVDPPSPCPPGSSGAERFPSRQPSLHKSSGSRELRQRARWPPSGTLDFPQTVKKVQSYRPTGSPGNQSIDHEQPSTPRGRPRSWIEVSNNEDSLEEAVIESPLRPIPVLICVQQVTTVTSRSKPRLVTISPRRPFSRKITSQPTTPLNTPPALVSVFSPDTPPETPDVADPSDNDAPRCQNTMEQRLASLDTTISHPFTPPSSRIPTPLGDCDKITRSASAACLQDHSCWVPPTMAQLDPSIAWILQELEALLAQFPMIALRLHSPVIKRLRAITKGVSVAHTPARHRSPTAAHSRYSPYRPLSSHPLSPQSSPGPNSPFPAPQADPTAFALRAIFPQARPHQLDSLQATYLASHFIANIPSSDFAMASASDVAASPFIASIKHSRSSSLISDIPPKARAMLGLDSPVQSPPPFASSPSPAVSWYRATSPELESDVKVRLENVELLLETYVRKILVEIEGRPLGRADDALVRAVGEVVKMGERNTGAAR